MELSYFLNNWNDILTIGTFGLTLVLGYYQIRYYRNQPPSLELVSVTGAEYTDFDDYTKYEFTVQLKNDGRDPVFIPTAALSINGVEIKLNNHEQYDSIAPHRTGTRFPAHEFRTIQLGANEFEHIELFGTGDAVDTIDPLIGELSMDTSVGDVETEITFDRAP